MPASILIAGHELETKKERYISSDTWGEYFECRKCGCIAYTQIWFEHHPCKGAK
jgi:hypothetical protein